MQIEYTPIGVIHSPFHTLADMPIQPAGAAGVSGTVKVFEEYRAAHHTVSSRRSDDRFQ